MSTHDLSDLSEVNQLHSAEPTLSIFFNRTIDWEDNTPNSTRVIVDFTILSIGLPLNFIILMTILTKTRLHNPIGCYIMSLTISNFVLLLNVLDDVLYHWFDIYFEPDLDFVGRVTLQSSSMTLVAFTLDRYMTICRRDTLWYKSATKLTTAVKGVLVIWCYASIATAMELNLYEHFRTRTIINIFCWSTGMYVALPTVIIVFLDSLMVMEIAENRDLEIVRWSCRDLAGLRLLGNLTLAFYVTMVPQRIVTILYYEDPQICCSPLTMNVCYYLAKVSSIAGPVICLGTHKTIQRSIQEIVLCHRGAVDINSSDSGKVAKNLSTEDHHIN